MGDKPEGTTTTTTPPEGTPPKEGTMDTTDYQAEADKWKAMSRKHEAQAKANAEAAKKVEEMENASKSDIEKAAAATAAAEKRAADAEAKALRYEVALQKEVPAKLLKFLTGDTQEDIEAAADELLEAVKGDTSGETTTTTAKTTPKEALKPGSKSEEGEEVETDPTKLVADIPRM